MTYSIDIYDAKGKKASTQQLDSDIFAEDKIAADILQQYVVMYQANQRTPIAHTKTRAEVNYSGKKLYKQKGTGNARVGDVGSPIRRHGGVAFGPRNERNFSKDMPKAAKKAALRTALILKAQSGSMMGLLDSTSLAKTKESVGLLGKLGVVGYRTLLVANKSGYDLYKATRNIPGVEYTTAQTLSPYDIVKAKKIIFLDSALEDVINKCKKK